MGPTVQDGPTTQDQNKEAGAVGSSSNDGSRRGSNVVKEHDNEGGSVEGWTDRRSQGSQIVEGPRGVGLVAVSRLLAKVEEEWLDAEEPKNRVVSCMGDVDLADNKDKKGGVIWSRR